MELALSTTRTSSYKTVQRLLPAQNKRLFVGHIKPINFVPPPRPPSRFTFSFSRRRRHDPAIKCSSSKKNKASQTMETEMRILPRKDDVDDDDFEGDPFEVLFSMLEEDLENDDSTVDDDDDDDDEINEEDIDKLARKLEEAIGDDIEMFNMAKNDKESDQDKAQEEEEEEEDEEDEREVKLKKWQLRKLAYALKAGRRKTAVKNLSAELCLDRAIVLEMLRDPPPNLLMMSATLPDKLPPTVVFPEVKPMEAVKEATADAVEDDNKVKEPVHARQHRWSAQKRLKKVQVETLEMVYRRSKRPTNAMISSIVHVTNLPRRRIVEWFEDKRAEEGVPDRRSSYQRPDSETAFSS